MEKKEEMNGSNGWEMMEKMKEEERERKVEVEKEE